MVLSSIFSKGGAQMGGGDIVELLLKNRVFLFKIFANLIAQLGITYYVMDNSEVIQSILLPFLLSLVCVIVIAGTNLPYWMKLVVFSVLSITLGKMMTRLKKKYGDEVIKSGIIGAMLVFALMFVIGLAMPVIGPEFGIMLFVALLALIIARIVGWVLNKTSEWKKWLSGAGIGIFGLYVMYDTNNMLRRANYYQGDFVTASLDYYLDIINLVQDIIGYHN